MTTVSKLPETALALKFMQRKKRVNLFIFGAVVFYLAYIFASFDFYAVFKDARGDNAAILVSDSYSHKTQLVRNNRTEQYKLAIEGEKKGEYNGREWPEWVMLDGAGNAQVSLEDGYSISFDGDEVTFRIPQYGDVVALPSRRGVKTSLPDGDVPDFINVSKNRLTVTTPAGRLSVTKAKTTVFKYDFGWELFFFTLTSDYYGKSFSALMGDVFAGEARPDGRTHAAAIFNDFWYNPMWRHGEVAWALLETILMAFLGTFGAALIAIILAFLSASNFAPSRMLRFGLRRFFDFLRGVDGLIWTIILSRAFGPGPLTGSLAILLTDTGTFGKLFSEALENVDSKQIEGVRSTGAPSMVINRYGVIPQIMPVLLSQILYYMESNTRSATVIGAIVGGGIGLMLTQAIITQKDWEEVSYYIVLIIFMVMIMDTLSGFLRRRLIKGE